MTPGRYRQLAGRNFFWLAALLPCPALPQAVDHGDFSVRFPSPEIPAPWDASDILKFSGTAVLVEGSALTPPGVAFNPVDEIDGISTGQDRISPPGPGFRVALEYSAGRRSAGLGGPVTNQGLLNGNGDDKLRLYITPTGRRVGPFLESDAPNHHLTPLPNESELDALSAPPGLNQPIYFTIDRFTATSWTAQTHTPWDAAAIHVVKTLGDPPKVYATSQQLGLQRGFSVGGNLVGDDIDALAIADFVSPGVFDGNEIIWISLDGVSPTRPLYLLGCDGVIQVNPPAPPIGFPPIPPPLRGIVIMAGPVMDLSCAPPVYDELDAITAIDPGIPCKDKRERKLWCVGEEW
jgi:hypothetical protein